MRPSLRNATFSLSLVTLLALGAACSGKGGIRSTQSDDTTPDAEAAPDGEAAPDAEAAPTALHPLGYRYVASEHHATMMNILPGVNPPPTADVSQYAPLIGDQGQIGDCTTWAVGYGLSSWLANKAGLNGGNNVFAPMFIFTHFAPAGSTDFGISGRDALNYLTQSGIDTVADYDQQMPTTFSTVPAASIPNVGVVAAADDTVDPPTAAVVQNALNYKLQNYQVVFDTPPQSNPGVCPGYPGGTLPIEAAIASGTAVVIAIPVPPEFDNYDGVHPVQPPTATEVSRGGHMLLCTKYDTNGLWCHNSWGMGWGAGGLVQLSWAFVEQCIWETDTGLGIAGTQTQSPLTANITSPSNGQTVSGTLPITVIVTPGPYPVSSVSILVNGSAVGSATSSGLLFSYSLDTTQLANGPESLLAVATDSGGNTANSDPVIVNVGN
jgi:Big-like domain-containing protein